MKKIFVTASVVLMLSVFLFVSFLLFTELTFAQDRCVGSPDAPIAWKDCLVQKDGSFLIIEPQYGTEKDGFLPLHGIISTEGGADIATPNGFCQAMKRNLVANDHRFVKKPMRTIALSRNGNYRGTYNSNFYYYSLTCRR